MIMMMSELMAIKSSSMSNISNWLVSSSASSSKTAQLTANKKKPVKSKKKNGNYLKLAKRMLKKKDEEEDDKELTKSPIAGTYIIKEWNKKEKQQEFTKQEVLLNSLAASFVEITPQSRAKLAKIPNKIGPYECKLCKIVYGDAFELAMHNCPRVVHMEYKCSECGKSFNCPANLASHKRWHKPKQESQTNKSNEKINTDPNETSQLVRNTVLQQAASTPILTNQAQDLGHQSSVEWLNQFYSIYYSIMAAAGSSNSNLYSNNQYNYHHHHQQQLHHFNNSNYF